MRLVIKIGTSTLTLKDGLLNRKYIFSLAKHLSELQDDNHEIIIVSSGAVGAGQAKLGLLSRPKTTREKQAFAAVGQPLVMNAYSDAFLKYGKTVAQILLTREVFDKRTEYINARNTLNVLIQNKVVPIINENDTVSISELNFGDNDTLAALVASTIDADKLILFTDVDGFYRGNLATSELIHKIDKITEDIESYATSGSSSGKGTGGMKTKITAAKIATASGVDTVITNGLKLNLLKNIISDCQVGTVIKAKKQCLQAKKSWIAFSKKSKGTIFVDTKAADILLNKGKSLLSAGIVKITGPFHRGDTVNIANIETKKDFARGLTNYDSSVIEKIKGKKTIDIKKIMDIEEDEIIHRDNLVLLQ
ncbi:glutamate 5-kinase [Candidatus Endomicrobiellum agilis]|uniref:glutamate 5-kinase n=1 Tax=Candidatus Endomicrobiellum agilis TaxID=3238957 RepID=UPI0035857641|nr:glutamate 5-kinase [Endomicrobium sp.]